MLTRLSLAAATLLAASTAALAHVGDAGQASFTTGLAHPLGGADHVLAMIAVGLWAALAGGRSLWAWPVAFVAAMLVGGGLGMAGMDVPFVEPGILASIVVLGLLVALAVRAPLAAGAALVAAFGVLHGHAHGAEAPLAGSAAAYALGFALATAALHAVGISAGLAAVSLGRRYFIRAAGGLSAVAGLALALIG